MPEPSTNTLLTLSGGSNVKRIKGVHHEVNVEVKHARWYGRRRIPGERGIYEDAPAPVRTERPKKKRPK